ncbi:MAG: cytochrome c oxidase subunit I [Pseudohongiella sp.]|nr:cytochrome c oxidase subunit I [Pseudohongiella sp.]
MNDFQQPDQNRHDRDQELHRGLMAIWSNLPGWGSLSAVNHTTVGVRFMVTGAVFFLIGGVLAMLMRSQLALPDNTLIDAAVYNQLFTMHGTVMMFLFAIPVLEGLGIYMVPKMTGTRDLLFPRIGAFGYYCYLFGGIIIMYSLFAGIAPDAGWFMYTPLSDAEFSPGRGSDFWLLGITFVEISAVSAGVELTVSILRGRAPGMTLTRMPIFCWSILAMSLMIVFGFPPLILASILLELERAASMPFFNVAAGGDPLLWQHLFWLFGHPEVYIIYLPAAGVVSTLIPVFARRPLVGYGWVVFSIVLMAFISFAIWAHHMFTVGIPVAAQAFFSIASMLVAIPTGIQVFSWLATLWSGRVVFALPMLWIFGFLVIFVCGGLTGVMLALVPFNWQVHDTHFVVAHMHYVLVGGMFFPMMAGLYYWLPLFSGRMPSEKLGRWGFWLTFGGFNMTFLLMHLTGLLGMPRRVYTYESGLGWDWLNLLSSVGGFVMAAGIAVIIIDIAMHFRFGRKAPQNPWQADTLEWALEAPPPPYNFISIPSVSSRHPLWDNRNLAQEIAAGEHAMADFEHGRREVPYTSGLDARPQSIVHLPGNSWIPLQAATVMAVLCICLLTRWYLLAAVAAVISGVMLLRWSCFNGAHPQSAPVNDKRADDLQLHSRTLDGPGIRGMKVTIMADATLYLCLLFGWIYFWISPDRPLPDQMPLDVSVMVACSLFVLLANLSYLTAVRRAKAGMGTGLEYRLWLTCAFGLLHCISLAWILVFSPLQFTTLTHDALIMFAILYLMFHSVLALFLTLIQIQRYRAGYVSELLPYEFLVLAPWWIYTTVIAWSVLIIFAGLPMLWPIG